MIETKQLQYKYSQEQEGLVLDGVDLQMREGEFVAVLGHNGSGKSTLAKHLNAILLPAGGKVYVDQMDTSDEQLLFDIRQRVGMVFQNPDNQIVATIVEDDVAFAPENMGVPSPQIRERVDWALKTVGMYNERKRAPHLLSGGQKQRVAIAGVLAMRPRYIVLDEPTAMLDPIGRREVLATLQKLHAGGMGVVLITHNMDEAIEAERVIVMDQGRVLMDGTPQQVFSDVERIKSVGLDVPQVTELMDELKKAGIPISDVCLDIEQAKGALAPLLAKEK